MLDKYINNINKNNINDFALKNNIKLNKDELDLIYKIFKTKNKDLLKGKDIESIDLINKNLTEENKQKVLKLYYYYKDMFTSYIN